jgi:hypothetical protein
LTAIWKAENEGNILINILIKFFNKGSILITDETSYIKYSNRFNIWSLYKDNIGWSNYCVKTDCSQEHQFIYLLSNISKY